MAELINTRVAFGKALVELGRSNPDVVVLSADVSNSDHSFMFADEFPDRFINTGIAEQSLVDCAVGLALAGKIPFVNTFGVFLATRAVEMIRTHVCYGRANVKLMAAYGGVSPSFEGPTHHATEDIAILRTFPGMRVVVPADPYAQTELLRQVAASDGPVYFRMNRNEVPAVYGTGAAGEAANLQLGRAQVVRPGSDLDHRRHWRDGGARRGRGGAVGGRGRAVPGDRPAHHQAARRRHAGAAARDTGAVVTAEEHTVIGGLGGAVTEALAERCPVPVVRVGIADCFTESGPYFGPARPPWLRHRRRGRRRPPGTRAQDTGRMRIGWTLVDRHRRRRSDVGNS